MTAESAVAAQCRHSHTDPSAITDMDHLSIGSSTWPLKSFLEPTVWHRKQVSSVSSWQFLQCDFLRSVSPAGKSIAQLEMGQNSGIKCRRCIKNALCG